ncbi:hypothetical protein AZE42_11155 [Rhizopogon vesiculosus]|uniref:Protein kinase domain-containing protein n=1 Tax=Rhizopogon vesiculosus TaxID=180088 RepID=A0A1J8QI96_9AGAM|nr:hypothetical protein AZE42_11155 [Rhizopogon vesiculosus]
MSTTTSLDIYLCGASLSSAGPPYAGGHTADTTNGLLKLDLQGHVIDKTNSKIPTTADIFSILFSKSSLTEKDIRRIHFYPRTKNALPVYSDGRWNLNPNTKPKQSNTGTSSSIDAMDTENEASDSNGPAITSEDSDSTWDGGKYDGTVDPGSKRKRILSTEKSLEYLFKAIIYSLWHKPLQSKITFNNPPNPESEPVKRYWSAEFASTPIPDLHNSQKPNVALFNYENKETPKTWKDVLSFLEHTVSNLMMRHDLPVLLGSTTKAYLIMREQLWRCVIVYFTISTDFLRTHYIDHSGLIMSRPVNIHSYPVLVTEAIGTVSLADLKLLGFDDTIHMCTHCRGSHTNLADGAMGWVYDNSGKQYSIMEVLWKSQGVFCEGTACYRIRDPDDRMDYAMKDCWVTEEKRYHEVDVLKKVKGIPNVVELMDHWDVKFGDQDDCTSLIRQQYDIPLKDRGDDSFCNRYHWRLVMKPCGVPLSHFRSRKELICAFCDFVIAHDAMTKVQVLHGDLSPNNFILCQGTSYFIDFDHATILKEGSMSPISFGTGTMPYISLRILRTMTHNSSIVNDLKSKHITSIPEVTPHLTQIIHASSTGAHGETVKTLDKSSMPWSEAYENLRHPSGMSTGFYAKKGAMSESLLLAGVSDYFKKFTPIIDKWHSLIHHSYDESNQENITHDHIHDMLEKFIATLDDESPHVLPSPSLPLEPSSSHTTTGSPTFQSTLHDLQPTGGSGSSTGLRPRYSLRPREKTK